MVYYEPRVTQADKDHITHRLSKYVMDIRHDQETYKHLHCYMTMCEHPPLVKPPVVGI